MTRGPATSCHICRRKTKAAGDLCGRCKVEVPLTGGAWVPTGRGTVVWEPDKVRRERQPPRPPIDLTDLIACPTCRAKVTESCRTPSGHTTTPHGSRLAPRLCLCGELLTWRRRLCDPCAAKALRASKRDYLRRLRGTPPERYRVAA